ncbi:MAG: VOC family protein [Bacteroidota bacterium]
MRIEHIAIWTERLELLKDFYVKYFEAQVDADYFNPKKNFRSYFLSFSSGSRLELMQMPTIPPTKDDPYQQFRGIIHFAFEVRRKEEVDQLTEDLAQAGFEVVGQPRMTGDGYYESVIFDPDHNRVEIAFKPS